VRVNVRFTTRLACRGRGASGASEGCSIGLTTPAAATTSTSVAL
jgi:hypothetical protein